MKRLFRAAPVQYALAALLTGYLKLTFATLRWRREGLEVPESVRDLGQGAIACFWHGRIAVSPPIWPRIREQSQCAPRALISLSPDGEFIARTMAWFGYPAIRGSKRKASDPAKKKGGSAAFREAAAWIGGGGGLAVTPDGPRGPAEVMAAGVPRLAKATGAPVMLVGLACRPALRLASWDAAMIPLPFGIAAVVWTGPFYVSEGDDPDTVRLHWSAALSDATRRAEALVA